MSPTSSQVRIAKRLWRMELAQQRRSPVKYITTTALIFTFFFFLTTYARSEEHYIYKDGQGKLVISNQRPPVGSNILRIMDLPEFREVQMQPVQEISSARSTVRLESSAKPEPKK